MSTSSSSSLIISRVATIVTANLLLTTLPVLTEAFSSISPVQSSMKATNTIGQQGCCNSNHNYHKRSTRIFGNDDDDDSSDTHSDDENENENKESSFDEELDLDDLMDQLDQSKEDSYSKLFASDEWTTRSKPNQAHVIIFKQDTPDEGVHSIEYPLGSGKNFILAFESSVDCNTFVGALQDMEFFDPSPIEMEVAGLEEYCAEMGGMVQVQCVPKGFDLLPPSVRVDELDHNPDLREDKQKVEKLFELELTKEEIREALEEDDDDDDDDGAGSASAGSSTAWE